MGETRKSARSALVSSSTDIRDQPPEYETRLTRSCSLSPWMAFSASSSVEKVTKPKPRDLPGSSRALYEHQVRMCTEAIPRGDWAHIMTMASVIWPNWEKVFLSESVVVRLGEERVRESWHRRLGSRRGV